MEVMETALASAFVPQERATRMAQKGSIIQLLQEGTAHSGRVRALLPTGPTRSHTSLRCAHAPRVGAAASAP